MPKQTATATLKEQQREEKMERWSTRGRKFNQNKHRKEMARDRRDWRNIVLEGNGQRPSGLEKYCIGSQSTQSTVVLEEE